MRRGLAPESVRVRVRIVRRFAAWIAPRHLLGATASEVEAFLDAAGPLSARTRYCYVSHLHRFYDWAVNAGHLIADPTQTVIRPRLRPYLPRPAADVDVALALELSTGAAGVMVHLAALAGLRCIEIARLARADVRDAQGRPALYVLGKGDKPRHVPLHARALEVLRALPMPHSGPILTRADGQAYEPWGVSQAGNAALRDAGVAATMHQLRHWYGTNLYRTSGRDILLVRDLMGHSSVLTTQGYVAADRAGAAEAVALLADELGQAPIDVPLPLDF